MAGNRKVKSSKLKVKSKPKAKAKKPVKKVAKKVIKKKVATNKKIVKKKKTLLRKKKSKNKKQSPLKLVRHENNPVLTPRTHLHWDARAAFNPSALLLDGKVHIVYRAVGHDDISRIGYALSSDGFKIDDRLDHPIYNPSFAPTNKELPKIDYSSGGGTAGGFEDPRLTEIDGRIYMIYTAFDGWSSLRLALTSIAKEDFLSHNWRWRKPVLISPPGEIHKNWVLFPSKIGGKYAILTGVSPRVQVAYFNSLDELDGKTFIKSDKPTSNHKLKQWDNWMRGTGPAPIPTKDGWLVLYHAMDLRDPNRYKMGAMVLDLHHPEKIKYRSKEPILEPDMPYENEGFKSGVVYSCGAVVKDGALIIYYGGADTVICVAAANFEHFMRELTTHLPPKIGKLTHR